MLRFADTVLFYGGDEYVSAVVARLVMLLSGLRWLLMWHQNNHWPWVWRFIIHLIISWYTIIFLSWQISVLYILCVFPCLHILYIFCVLLLSFLHCSVYCLSFFTIVFMLVIADWCFIFLLIIFTTVNDCIYTVYHYFPYSHALKFVMIVNILSL